MGEGASAKDLAKRRSAVTDGSRRNVKTPAEDRDGMSNAVRLMCRGASR
jgi:hypothetical protein